MVAKDQIAAYYFNAREFVKQNNPKAARAYVLAILNHAVESLKSANSILEEVRTKAFLDRWIRVSQELYDKGISNYVLESFGLTALQAQNKARSPKKQEERAIGSPNPADGEIDMAGLIEESAKTQGWGAEIFERNKNAVVGISVYNSGQCANGTGFIISKNGYLLTNDHVVFDEDAQGYYPKIKISFADRTKSYKLNVLFSDKNADVAFCSFDPAEVGEFTAVKRIADYSRILPCADCLVMGNSFGNGLSAFLGVIRFTKNDKGNLVHTAPSNPGDSGAPVFNRQGECIGINKSKTLAVQNVTADAYANATPMDKIDELLKKWCDVNEIIL